MAFLGWRIDGSLTIKIYQNHMANGSSARFATASSGLLARCTAASSRPPEGVVGRALAGMLLFAAAAISSPAQAQQANQPAYDSRQTEKHFEDLQSGRDTAARSRLPIPRISRTEVPTDTKPLFVLRQIIVSGAVAIPRDVLSQAYRSYIGRKVSQADLNAIAMAVGDIYRTAGFHLSRAIVPPQDIHDGRIRLQVVEGRITEVTLKGEGAEQFGIRPMLSAVVAEQPSRLATLERQLLLINGQPGVRIEDTGLEEIGTATGRFRLTVYVKAWHLFTSFGVDNLGLSSVNSYLAPGDSLVVNLSTTPTDPRQLAFGRVAYDVPVGTDGARVGASGYYSEVWPGDARHLYSDNTKTESFEFHGSIVPLQSQKSSLTLTAAMNFSNAAENDVFGSVYRDHIRFASLTSDYRLQDNFGGTNYLTLNYRQGLDILGASQSGDDFSSREGASSDFSALNFWFTRYQTLSDAWSVKLAGAGQWASGPLFLSQQFYLGGAAFGRGYGSAEISGDNGIAGTFELRFDQKAHFRYLSGYQLYAFVDSGTAWNDGYGFSDGLSLTSAGVGVRLFLVNDLQADIGVAVPLSYRAPDNTSRSARFLFSLSSAFSLCPARPQTGCL
jgi:hemolysin activation/secretion protein